MRYYSPNKFYFTKCKISLKFVEIKINKKEFHKSKQPIDLNLVDTNKIVVFDKFEHNDESFIGYKDDR